jgi:hypothetical protein
MKRIFVLSLVLAGVLAILLGWSTLRAEEQQHGPPPSDDPRFEFLKQLQGTWVTEGNDEMPGGVFEFRVTAGGHAVEERELIGTPMEMLTVYHMQGKELVATHYCMLGNQPHMKAAKKVLDNTLDFACNGKPGNSRSHDEEHVHGWSMRLDPDGTLRYSGELLREGTVTEAPAFVLTRQSETASR